MDPSPAQTTTSTRLVTAPTLASVAEGAELMRSDLVRTEQALRVLWQEAADLDPVFAARLSVAAHLAHDASLALSSEGLIGAT